MTDPAEFSRDLAPLGLVTVNHIAGQAKKALAATREFVSGNLRPGERIAAVAPDGTFLGHVTRKVDTTEARVTDEAVLMGHLYAENPDSLYDHEFIAPGVSERQVIAVLKKYAPEMVDSEARVHPWAVKAALGQVMAGGSVPGIEIVTVPGTTAVYPDKAAGPAIEALIRSGVVGIDGVVHPRIEGAQA